MSTQSTGTITSVTTSTPITLLQGFFNFTLTGGVGTVSLQKSYDGITYLTVSQDSAGTPASYTLAANDTKDFVGQNVESGALWRVNVTAYTSGNIFYRFGTPG